MVMMLALVSVPLGAQEKTPLEEANESYEVVISLVMNAAEALGERDFFAFREAVQKYRRQMPWVLIWQSRACWAASEDGADSCIRRKR